MIQKRCFLLFENIDNIVFVYSRNVGIRQGENRFRQNRWAQPDAGIAQGRGADQNDARADGAAPGTTVVLAATEALMQ
jgi:hypothetical protein